MGDGHARQRNGGRPVGRGGPEVGRIGGSARHPPQAAVRIDAIDTIERECRRRHLENNGAVVARGISVIGWDARVTGALGAAAAAITGGAAPTGSAAITGSAGENIGLSPISEGTAGVRLCVAPTNNASS